MTFNLFINRYFGFILLTAAVFGLFIELPEINISHIIILSLGGIIFASFFKIDLTLSVILDDLKPISVYFLLRFILIPTIVYFVFALFSPFYAMAFLLLLLLPTAVSTPAFTVMFGGSVKLSLKLLVFTSFMSILTIPGITQLLVAQKVDINGSDMFMTMVYTIVYPFILHIPFRRMHSFRKIINNNGPFITATGLSIIFIVSTSFNRVIILGNPGKMLVFAGIAVVFYLICYLIGYYLMHRETLEKRIAYSISSGANNIGLGVTLTALFFPGNMNVLFIISQLAWIIILIPMRHFYIKISRKNNL